MCFEIMLSALTEDDRSFVEKLYLKYGDYMYSVAYGVLKHRQDAEDAVNDAMCKIMKYLSKFEKTADETVCNMVVICIKSIVRNKAIDKYNQKKKLSKYEIDCRYKDEASDEFVLPDFEDEAFALEDMVIRKEECEIVRNALLTLTEDMQNAINLVYMCGYSCVEAADFLGISDAAVRARLFKARRKLKTILDKELNGKC